MDWLLFGSQKLPMKHSFKIALIFLSILIWMHSWQCSAAPAGADFAVIATVFDGNEACPQLNGVALDAQVAQQLTALERDTELATADRITHVATSGSAFAQPTGWAWGYDALGQMTSAVNTLRKKIPPQTIRLCPE
ncbi:MAG: hypothetical protein ACOYOF_09235 [Verrucomicrobiaceae bacterium]